MNRRRYMDQLPKQSALRQSRIAIVLIAGFPVIATLYIWAMLQLQPEQLSLYIPAGIFASTIILAATGCSILLKFPKNIMRLRQYIAEAGPAGFPSTISLSDTRDSDDLRHIENDLNAVLRKMRQQIEQAELNQRKEHWLREKVEEQQRALIHAERHRAMIQSLGAACHHLGQPVTTLKIRLYLMKQHGDLSEKERENIAECETDIEMVQSVLERLRTVSQFRTEPYISDENKGENEILAI